MVICVWNRATGWKASLRTLSQIPGIGEWTAQYIAMRGSLSWPDAYFPHTDLGISRALKEKNAGKILELTDKWRPWARAIAALHLWSTTWRTPPDRTFNSTYEKEQREEYELSL